MKIGGKHYRSVWPIGEDAFGIIDQTKLPHEFATVTLRNAEAAAHAILTMQTRGAPLIGAVGAYGLALAVREDASDENIQKVVEMLAETRPTAINLKWALWRMRVALLNHPREARTTLAWQEAATIADEDVAMSEAIGRNGLKIIRDIAARKPGKTVNILTHCNAGWLATVDYGTALAPIYLAHDDGIPLHVWVDETRPRNQGASLTAFELGSHGVDHTILADNAGGHYMQAGEVDMVIVGTDRVTAHGDVANKIGTYLKALAARDCGVPLYAAVPSPTIDWSIDHALAQIPIEDRPGAEVRCVRGRAAAGVAEVEIAGTETAVANPAFDVTPARLVTGIITERGVAAPAQLARLYPAPPRAA